MTRTRLGITLGTVAILGAAAIGFQWFRVQRQWWLTDAAAAGDLGRVKLLCALGADPNAFPQRGGAEGAPALYEAVTAGHNDVVRFLLEHGATTEISFSDVRSPLEAAIGARLYETAELLLGYGASVNRGVGLLTPTMFTPPLDAKWMELLRRYGAITGVEYKKVPPTLFFCTGKPITDEHIMNYLDEAVPRLYSLCHAAQMKESGSLHIEYRGRDRKHPGSFHVEVAIPIEDSKYSQSNRGYSVPPKDCYFHTSSEFRCLTVETKGPRLNIEAGTDVAEGAVWSGINNLNAYPTNDFREVYRIWKSADSSENEVELQVGIHHPAIDRNGRHYEEADRIPYAPGE